MYPTTSSGLKTSDAAIVTRPCILHALTLIGAGADSDVTVYDNASAASGTAVAKAALLIASTKTVQLTEMNVECKNGLYIDINGTDAAVILHYSLL